MEDFDLIKQMYNDLDDKNKQPEKPEDNPFAKAEEVARQLGLNEQEADPKSDIARLAKNYKGSKKSKEELRKAIGHDLEMLEYSPEQVSKMVPKVLAACCGE